MDELTAREEMILKCLKKGRNNRTTRGDLVAMTGMDDASIRQQINSMRLKGIWIMSKSGRGKNYAGYWITEDPSEVMELCKSMTNRGLHDLEVAGRLEKSLLGRKMEAMDLYD